MVSAGLKPEGAEEAVWLLVSTDKLQLFVSRVIVAEYQSVLRRSKLNLAPDTIEFLLQLSASKATFVEPAVRLFVSPDEKDNRFLECAEASDANYLITGNKRHFPARWKRTEIINARELHARLASQ